jgi:hypothetical protein
LPAANSQPWAISGFYDGTIWFTERAASKIAQINTSGRVLQEILTPTLNSQPQSLVIGPDGNLWFTEQAGDILGRLAGGTITEFAIPTVGSMPGDAVVGPDGALWFTEQAGNKIGRFTPLSNTPLLASILPSSRSPEVPHAATAFATIINSESSAATGCAIAPLQYVPVSSFQYQTTNPATNALTGTVNTPVNIPAGQFQTYVIALTPSAPFPPIDLQFSFSCANANAAPIFLGIDTLQYSSSSTAVPDVVALAATARNDGILHIAGIFGSSAFAVATVNVGAAGHHGDREYRNEDPAAGHHNMPDQSLDRRVPVSSRGASTRQSTPTRRRPLRSSRPRAAAYRSIPRTTASSSSSAAAASFRRPTAFSCSSATRMASCGARPASRSKRNDGAAADFPKAARILRPSK